MKFGRQFPFELIFWIAALVLLAWEAPGKGPHVSLCPLLNLGMTWCPGCGIGRAIGLLMHGSFEESITQHWFGIPALFIILCRIFVLIKITYMSARQRLLKREERNYV